MTTRMMKLSDVGLVFFYGRASIRRESQSCRFTLFWVPWTAAIWRGFGAILVGPDKPDQAF